MNTSRWRDIAARMRDDAEGKLRNRETHTAKKLAQARQSEREGRQYQRAATLMEKLCDAAESGAALDPVITGAKLTKQDFLSAVSFKATHVSNGYHGYAVDSRDYSSMTPLHVALRALLEKTKTPAEIAAEKEQQRAIELARKIDSLRGCDIPGFFPTPLPVIEQMIEAADIEQHHRVLEPSAGLGDIVAAIKATGFTGFMDAIEINSSLCEVLGLRGFHHQRYDFLQWTGTKYDRILMNPPFERRQAVAHIRHAHSLLRPGGRIVALLPPNHVDDIGLDGLHTIELHDNAFNGTAAFRRTGVSVAMVVIDKMQPAEEETFVVEKRPRQQCLFV